MNHFHSTPSLWLKLISVFHKWKGTLGQDLPAFQASIDTLYYFKMIQHGSYPSFLLSTGDWKTNLQQRLPSLQWPRHIPAGSQQGAHNGRGQCPLRVTTQFPSPKDRRNLERLWPSAKRDPPKTLQGAGDLRKATHRDTTCGIWNCYDLKSIPAHEHTPVIEHRRRDYSQPVVVKVTRRVYHKDLLFLPAK